MINHIYFGKTVISYEVEFSNRRKTTTIQVSETGIKAIVPTQTPEEKIRQLVTQKAAWIIKNIAEFTEIQNYEQEIAFLSGEKLPYIGRNYRLKIQQTAITTHTFQFKQGRFIATVPTHTKSKEYRDLLLPLFKDWLLQKAIKIAHISAERFAMKFPYQPKEIKIKGHEQRWGSCTASGNVILNWRIFLAPMYIVDYVIAHELAHLKYLNHSKSYWETLEMLYPNYIEAKGMYNPFK